MCIGVLGHYCTITEQNLGVGNTAEIKLMAQTFPHIGTDTMVLSFYIISGEELVHITLGIYRFITNIDEAHSAGKLLDKFAVIKHS